MFDFTPVTPDKARKEILNLDGSKATVHGDIPAQSLKESTEIH